MKYQILVLLLFIGLGQLAAQNPDFNVSVISNVMYPEGNNDVWGYVDTNDVEYAVIGTRTATVVLSLADPANPSQIYRVDGSSSIWRDMKTFDRYIYSVCDNCSDGLVVIDMTDPENPVHQILTSLVDSARGGRTNIGAFHNIFVDEFGFLYADGGNINNGGIVILDLNQDPWNPHIVGYGDPRYSHDIYVRDNIIYSADINNGFFSVVNATDKNNLTLLATQNTTSFFTHNTWLSDDSKTLFTTDEKDFSYLDAYDISDLDDIKRIDTYRPPSTDAAGVTPHNAHVFNDYVIVSWYTDGLKIVDAQYPDNLIEVGSLDTWNGPGGGTEGCWGAYPFLPSGLILVSDIATGLYVLQPNYVRASYLHGKVTDAVNGSNITQVKVDIMGDRPNLNQTSNFGTYKTGLAETGNFDIKFSHPLYQDTIVNVRLKGDSITILDMVMQPLFDYLDFSGTVVDANGKGVAGASVLMEGNGITYELKADNDGKVLRQIFDMDYQVRSGLWGYGDTMFAISAPASNVMEILLPGDGEYYQDRFIMDQGWAIVNDAETGSWERGEPLGTNFQGPLNPGTDSPNDFGTDCYGTGLVGSTPFDFDVDGVYNTLTSPAVSILGDETAVNFSFDFWYQAVDIGNGLTDSMVVNLWLDNQFVAQIEKIDLGLPAWRKSTVHNLLDFFDFAPVVGEVKVSFVIGDDEPGNPLEAAIDNIKIVLDRTVGTKAEIASNADIMIYPNPVQDVLTIDWSNYSGEIQQGSIYNIEGKQIHFFESTNRVIQIPFTYPKGLYTVHLIDENGNQFVKKIVR